MRNLEASGFMVSHEVAVKLLVRHVVSSCRLVWVGSGGSGTLLARSLLWLLAGLVSLIQELLHRAASRHGSWLPLE